MRTFEVDQTRTRWVAAVPGDAPLHLRMTGYAAELSDLGVEGDSTTKDDVPLEIVAVSGPDAAHFPLEGERPLYWESLHQDDEFVGEFGPRLELYRRGDQFLVVDDTGPGSPELLGTFPTSIGPRPVDPDDIGISEDDPRWMEMSDLCVEFIRAVGESNLAQELSSMGAMDGWFLIELIRTVGFDIESGFPAEWFADRAAELFAASDLS